MVNGPFRPEYLVLRDSQASGPGYKNEPFRLKYSKNGTKARCQFHRAAISLEIRLTVRYNSNPPLALKSAQRK
jgi:hypothetical protein